MSKPTGVERFRVASYGQGLWCVVDTTKFLDDEQRRNNWPLQVREVPAGRDRDQMQRAADSLNESDRLTQEQPK